jgi:hypothetical protein
MGYRVLLLGSSYYGPFWGLGFEYNTWAGLVHAFFFVYRICLFYSCKIHTAVEQPEA